MKKNEHETLREKFWDWWEYTSLEDMVISGLVLVIVTAVAVVLTAFVVWLFMQMFGSNDLPVDEPAEGVGRNPAVVRYLAGAGAEEIGTALCLDTYTEGDAPVPAWWNPEEPMAVEWREVERYDIGCPDYAIEAEVIPSYLLDVPLDRWFQEYLHGLCEAEGVPYLLAVAVIEAESGYDPGAVSVCGDYGLMQINEVCHEWLGAELGITDFLDPWQNARAGVYLLGMYYRDFGYESGTLMAYNMGREAAEELFARGIYATDYSDRVIGIRGRLEARNG